MTLERRNSDRRRGHAKSNSVWSPMGLHYVIQQHKSKNTHWDLRLQIGDEMWSWAIPKGPSLNPRDARLAVETKPHDMEYNNFEGVIAKGLYGAGKVVQWDKGLYNVVENGDVSAMLQNGLIKFQLHGKKLKGKWALVKTNKEWLLIKMNDEHANKMIDIIKTEPRSVKSGKTINQITEEDGLIDKKEHLGWE